MKPVPSTKSQLAVPFISYTQSGGFFFNPQAQDFIRAIPDNKKIGAISIVGKYRTGKSFFVNRVLLQTKKSGFQVGPTINPCTKGLWIWKKTLPSKNPSHPDMETIIIDTEGFGGVDENANHDSRIFLFSLLLSSYFVYNSVGSIDENALNSLNLIINLANDIQNKAGNKADTSMFPAFLWVVRDFTLQLVDKDNNKLTASQYLENAVQVQPGTSQSIQNKNKIREQFNSVFRERDCVTMVIPIDKQSNIQRLDELDNSELRPQFKTQMAEVQNRIFGKIRPKSINGKTLNGSMFVQLVKGYIEIINSGNLPKIQNAWVYVCRSQGMKAASESIRKLEGKIEQELGQKDLLDQNQLAELRTRLQKDTLKYFKDKSMGAEESNPQILENLKKKMDGLFSDFIERNRKNWHHKYRELSEERVTQLRDKIFRDDYRDMGEFFQDLKRIKAEYEVEAGASDQKWVYFNEVAGQLQRLASEAIVTKIQHNANAQKQVLSQKVKLRETELNDHKKEFNEHRYQLNSKIEQLERQLSKTSSSEALTQQTIKNLKLENATLKDKCSRLEFALQEQEHQIVRVTNQSRKVSTVEMEQLRSEMRIMKSNVDQQKDIHQMQKEYHEKEVQSFKDKANHYESENRKLKAQNNTLTDENDNLKSHLEQIEQKEMNDVQLIEAYQKKIDQLSAETSKKSEMAKEHGDWLLEKSYLENQVSFLKNTLNENKRLHDALLVALQQSVSTVEGDGSNSLVETNKNLSGANQKLEARCRLLEEKSEKLKRFKKIVKNCTALQCLHCLKWIANAVFPQHLLACAANEQPQASRTNIRENGCIVELAGLHIAINQTVIKQIQENKPFTEYLMQITYYQKKWTVNQKFKSFCQLQQNLIQQFPSIRFPQSSSAIINVHTDINQLINSKKKTIAVEQRRKSLQQFMRDLAKIDVIRSSEIYKNFIKFEENSNEEDEENAMQSGGKFARQVTSTMVATKKEVKSSIGSYSGLKQY